VSDKPKPISQEGRVASLTQHRAEKSGQFEASVYDMPYRKGERIICDNPSLAYIVRIGKVRVRKEMPTQGGRNLVTVDFLDKDAPLLASRFIPGAKDDPDLQFFADTDVVIGEFPVDLIGRMADRPQFLASYARVASDHIYSLRRALFSQLERNQQKLEEQEEQRRQIETAQRKIDELADENLGMQMDLGDLQKAQTEAELFRGRVADLEKALAASERKVETLRKSNLDLRTSQEALRAAHDEEIERIASLSKERYAELRFRRDLDKERERRRWKAIEHLLARLGSPLLLPEEIAVLLGEDADEAGFMPAAEPPTITDQDVDSSLSFGGAEEDVADVDDSELIDAENTFGEEEPHTPTLIPPWGESVRPHPSADAQPPASCPQPERTPAARAPMLTLDLDTTLSDFVQGSERPAITQTAPIIRAFNRARQDPPPMPKTPPVPTDGVRTAVMPAMAMPRPPQASDPKIETRYSDPDGRWSWPGDGLSWSEEPKSAPISCPTPGFADDGPLSGTTETWNLSDLDNPKPKKR